MTRSRNKALPFARVVLKVTFADKTLLPTPRATKFSMLAQDYHAAKFFAFTFGVLSEFLNALLTRLLLN